jgi:hypothetical protein
VIKLYYLSIFLISHLTAGLVGTLIDYLFYRKEIPEVIEEINLEREIEAPFEINRKSYIIMHILLGWWTLFYSLKNIFDHNFEPEDDDED